MKNEKLDQLIDEFKRATQRSEKASRKWKRYKARWGAWHASTQRAWDELCESWRVCDLAWRAYDHEYKRARLALWS